MADMPSLVTLVCSRSLQAGVFRIAVAVVVVVLKKLFYKKYF